MVACSNEDFDNKNFQVLSKAFFYAAVRTPAYSAMLDKQQLVQRPKKHLPSAWEARIGINGRVYYYRY